MSILSSLRSPDTFYSRLSTCRDEESLYFEEYEGNKCSLIAKINKHCLDSIKGKNLNEQDQVLKGIWIS
jgi:hypothetical protein